MKSLIIALCSLFVLHTTAKAQYDKYKNKYEFGKKLLDEKKYDLAKNIFKDLIISDHENPYQQHSLFFFGYSHFRINQYSIAKDSLESLIKRFPKWKNIDNAKYLLGQIGSKTNNFDLAFKHFSSIQQQSNLSASANNAIFQLLKGYDVKNLKYLHKSHPENRIIAKVLFYKIAPNSPEDVLRKELNQKYAFEEQKIDKPEEKKERIAILKEEYNVAIVFPFEQNKIPTSSLKRKQQSVIDITEGAIMAKDKLKEEGVNINLFFYDTEKNTTRTHEILSSKDFKGMDMVIGPLYPNTIDTSFDILNSLPALCVNPVSKDDSLLIKQKNLFLLQPSQWTVVKKSAEYAIQNFTDSTAYIIYDNTNEDSIKAHVYKNHFESLGGKIGFIYKIKSSKYEYRNILNKLNTIKSKGQGHIYISATPKARSVNIVSALNSSYKPVPCLIPEIWLEYSRLIKTEQLQNINAHIAMPNYMAVGEENIRNFIDAYHEKIGLYPTKYSYMGYDCIYYFGKKLAKYGNLTSEKLLQDDEIYPETLQRGIHFNNSRSNQFIPFYNIEEGLLKLINNPNGEE